MEKLTLSEFIEIEKDIKKIVGAKINQITIISSRFFVMNFSMIKNENLFVSLDHKTPFLCMIKSHSPGSTLVGSLNETLRKYIRDSYVIDVGLLNKDRIFEIKLQKANELYEKEQYYLIFECIPQKPNMIILNSKREIIYAIHYSSVLSQRSIVQGMVYEAPNSLANIPSKSEYTIDEIKDFAYNLFSNSFNRRKEEKFEPLYKFIKIRTKSLEKKLNILDNSLIEANNRLSYKDHGSVILSLLDDKDECMSYIKENNVKYNEAISLVDNAENCFKIYKKAKRTIEMNNIEIEKCKNEISYLNSILTSSIYMNEDEIIALGEELLPHKYKEDKKHPKNVGIGLISLNDTKILFGKNAKSNDKLTFTIAEKKDTYLHIKDYHGSHVIIKSNSPSNSELLLAAEIALILSNKNDGEVYYTTVNNCKKGGKLGLVNLLSYNTINIKSIRKETYELLSNYKNI